jgi:uncharacterized protein
VFDWDDANREHVRKHHIQPHEAEEAWLDPDQVPAEVSHGDGGEWHDAVIGMTRTYRLLYVAWTERDNRIRIFLARKPTPQEARAYFTR